MKCATCREKDCVGGKDCTGKSPEIASQYEEQILKIATAASYIEATYYMKKTRIEELIEFAKMMGYKRIGIAFCIGLSREAETLQRILERHFEVNSVCCKVCGIPKSQFGLKPVSGNPDEVMCNPVGQAEVLNQAETDLNVIVGLCMGHDILFSKTSLAPVTTLVVKDRVLAHNPCGALYSNYYARRLR